MAPFSSPLVGPLIVTFTWAGLSGSITYLNSTGRVELVTLVISISVMPPSQIVSLWGTRTTRGVGSTQISVVSFIPTHFSSPLASIV